MQVENYNGGRIAINGMGRIGRTLLRILCEKNSLRHLAAVNDIMPTENLIYLLKYDSIHGTFEGEITSTADGFAVNGHDIRYTQHAKIEDQPWRELAIDTVVEATGLFTHSTDAAKHLASGAQRVLLTTFSKDLKSTVLGVNHFEVNAASKIISPGDCTINCVAPLIHLMQNSFGVTSVHVNVIQAYTSRQQLVDGPYKGFRRGRAAAHAIVPFEVNIKAVLEKIFPTLANNIESLSTRVPVPCGALADISLVLEKSTTADNIESKISQASHDNLKNLVAITHDPIVSTDILGNPHSSTVDGSLIRVTRGNHLKLFAWFDNEWGYASRLYDWLQFLGSMKSN